MWPQPPLKLILSYTRAMANEPIAITKARGAYSACLAAAPVYGTTLEVDVAALPAVVTLPEVVALRGQVPLLAVPVALLFGFWTRK